MCCVCVCVCRLVGYRRLCPIVFKMYNVCSVRVQLLFAKNKFIVFFFGFLIVFVCVCVVCACMHAHTIKCHSDYIGHTYSVNSLSLLERRSFADLCTTKTCNAIINSSYWFARYYTLYVQLNQHSILFRVFFPFGCYRTRNDCIVCPIPSLSRRLTKNKRKLAFRIANYPPA